MNLAPCNRYPTEFKAQAVELLSTGKPVSQVAAELCISSALRREVTLLRQENDLLKKAAVILGTRLPANCGK